MYMYIYHAVIQSAMQHSAARASLGTCVYTNPPNTSYILYTSIE